MNAADTAPAPLFRGFLDHDSEPVKRILVAAEQCVLSAGYGGMSMRDIAKEAGVSKSLLHYHFQSKEHLFLEVQIGVYNRLAVRVAEAVQPVQGGAKRTLLALEALFDVLRDRDDLPVQAEIWARSLTNEKLRVRAVELREYLREVVIRTFQRILGAEIDLLPISQGAAADLLIGALTGLGLQAGVEGEPERVDEAFEALQKLLGLALSALDQKTEE